MAKTVKVRIAVAVGEDGDWYAYGNADASDDVAKDEAREFLPSAVVHIVTAELPVPEPVEVEAQVEAGDAG